MSDTTLVKYHNFTALVDDVYQTHCALQQGAQRAVNINLTVRNYLIGCYIVEFEQTAKTAPNTVRACLLKLLLRLKKKVLKD